MEILSTIATALTENPGVAAGGIIGAIGGIAGGLYLGRESSVGKVLWGLVLGAAGLAAGLFAGHTIVRQIDKNTPAPLGMRPIDTPPIQPGTEGQIAMKPSAAITESVASEIESRFTNTADIQSIQKDFPEANIDQIKKFLPIIKQALPYAKVQMDGNASTDGQTIAITSVTIKAPGLPDIRYSVDGVTLPLKDGKIDQNSPEAKAKIKKIFHQGIDQLVPQGLQEKARELLDKTLSKNIDLSSGHTTIEPLNPAILTKHNPDEEISVPSNIPAGKPLGNRSVVLS